MTTPTSQPPARPIPRPELVEQVRGLGVARGGVLLVHTSFRALRPVEGGPERLVDALLEAIGPAGTLVMPSFTADDDAPFFPGTTPAAPDLGIVAETFRRRPGVRRSDHPFAFAAHGPLAAEITADPLPLPPHIPASPVGRVHDRDGQVLLLGVEQDSNTTLHLAELIAGVPYRVPHHCTVFRDGKPTRIDYGENDHCCQRFALADEWLGAAGKMAEGTVGHGRAKLMRARELVAAAVPRLQAEPLLFLHPPEAGCAECNLARASVLRPS